jgi:hypothetical protein
MVSDKVNAKSFFLPDANHFEAGVRNMPPGMKDEFTEAANKMLGVKVNLDAVK